MVYFKSSSKNRNHLEIKKNYIEAIWVRELTLWSAFNRLTPGLPPASVELAAQKLIFLMLHISES